jgi:hypothetical protein
LAAGARELVDQDVDRPIAGCGRRERRVEPPLGAADAGGKDNLWPAIPGQVERPAALVDKQPSNGPAIAVGRGSHELGFRRRLGDAHPALAREIGSIGRAQDLAQGRRSGIQVRFRSPGSTEEGRMEDEVIAACQAQDSGIQWQLDGWLGGS